MSKQKNNNAAAQGAAAEQKPLYYMARSFTKDFEEWCYRAQAMYTVVAHAIRTIDEWQTTAFLNRLCSSLNYVKEMNEELLKVAQTSGKKEVRHD